MPRTNSTPAPRAPKAPANYAKLADETELIRDGLTNRVDKVKAHIAEMLRNVPERAAIMQAFERQANWAAQLYDVQARLDRYIALRDRPADNEGGAASGS